MSTEHDGGHAPAGRLAPFAGSAHSCSTGSTSSGCGMADPSRVLSAGVAAMLQPVRDDVDITDLGTPPGGCVPAHGVERLRTDTTCSSASCLLCNLFRCCSDATAGKAGSASHLQTTSQWSFLDTRVAGLHGRPIDPPQRSVLSLPLRPPAVLARAAASLDV